MIQPTHLGEVRPVCQSPVWLTNPLTWHHRNLHSCSASQEIQAIILAFRKCIFYSSEQNTARMNCFAVCVENCREVNARNEQPIFAISIHNYLIQTLAIWLQSLRGFVWKMCYRKTCDWYSNQSRVTSCGRVQCPPGCVHLELYTRAHAGERLWL